MFVEDRPWLDPRSELRPEEIRADATLMTDYIASFGNAENAIKSYYQETGV